MIAKTRNLVENNTSPEMDVWNMSTLFLVRLDKRLDEVEIAFIDGDLRKAYRGLRIVYSNIYWFVLDDINSKNKDNAIKNKNSIESCFDNALQLLRGMGVRDETIINNTLIDLQIVLESLFFIMNTLMIDYGLVFSKRKGVHPKRSVEEF